MFRWEMHTYMCTHKMVISLSPNRFSFWTNSIPEKWSFALVDKHVLSENRLLRTSGCLFSHLFVHSRFPRKIYSWSNSRELNPEADESDVFINLRILWCQCYENKFKRIWRLNWVYSVGLGFTKTNTKGFILLSTMCSSLDLPKMRGWFRLTISQTWDFNKNKLTSFQTIWQSHNDQNHIVLA